jgi:hypothetical protein
VNSDNLLELVLQKHPYQQFNQTGLLAFQFNKIQNIEIQDLVFHYPLDEFYGDKVYDKSANGAVVNGNGSFAWAFSDFRYS